MKDPAPLRHLNKLASLLVALILASAELHAVPITYTLVVYRTPSAIPGTSPSGKLGAVSFGGSNGDVILTFTFEGDTANVIPFTTPTTPSASGYEILIGIASVQVKDANDGAVLAQGTFSSSAGIFVSVDNTNHGMGFGSFGTPPQSSMFPGQVVYPYGMEAYSFGAYDLRSDFSVTLYTAISCVNFPFLAPSFQCGAPIPLPTINSGDLLVDAQDVLVSTNGPTTATFTAQTHPMAAFSAFNATARIGGRVSGSFSLDGRFTLSSDSNGINPLTETVALQLGTYSVTLPPGSFKRARRDDDGGGFVFSGLIDGATLRAQIAPLRANSYSIRVDGSGANLAGTTLPATIVVTIGDDSGTTTAGAPREDD